ncbi:hypothetical protein LFT44_04375 [Arthrobacter sp. FW306-05-C]|uniref:hypothetical protein n=1 Tax=Arthrobacter sp. FW306-05-C TaxID=2879620 RepID=UPI001F2ACC25|nr:hypothetical protein [Arthrobacter sp. FW306-05-C]UKA67659.1 hypothetical protein LFT44_04375 [Arthrobacter sp. FW306-05-C]
MSFFTFSGNKLAMTVLAAGALAVGGTGVAAMAESSPDTPSVLAETESPSPSPTATETESPSPSPTATETESSEPTPTETETEAPDPTPTATETESPEPAPTETANPEPSQTSTPAGPDAFGPAAFGLCNAFTNGGLGTTSTAYAALVQAAGGEGSVGAYCATVAAPRGGEDGSDETATTEQGQVQQQQVKEQRQAAPAWNGGGHQAAGNGAKHGGHR